MAKSTKEAMEARKAELSELKAGIDLVLLTMDENESAESFLTATQAKRIAGNLNALNEYIIAEVAHTNEMLSKKAEPSKSAMLKALMKDMTDDEVKELMREKGITL